MASNELHIIRLDVLLFRLSGFAEPDYSNVRSRAYPAALAKKIVLLSQKDRAEPGEIERLAEVFQHSENSIRSKISQIRRKRRPVPEYWNLAA